MFFKFFAFALIFTLLFSSCEKDELTKPVEVAFNFKLGRETQENEYFKFGDGLVRIESIVLVGDREQGEDISFTSNFGSIIDANLVSTNTTSQILFDLPQGVYKKIELVINTSSVIVVNGQYKPSTIMAPLTPIKLEIDLPKINLLVKPEDGVSEILLNRNSGATVDIYMNPIAWIAGIPLITLDNAALEQIKGISSIVISRHSNPEIYGKLSAEVPSAIEAIIK